MEKPKMKMLSTGQKVTYIIAFILNISLIIPVLLYCSIFSKAIVITEYPAAAINPTDAGLNP